MGKGGINSGGRHGPVPCPGSRPSAFRCNASSGEPGLREFACRRDLRACDRPQPIGLALPHLRAWP